MGEMAERPHPMLQALLLADQVYVDRMTAKNVIAGTFDSLASPSFPAQFHAVTWAYICLTEIRGECNISLKYVDLSTNQVLLQTKEMNVKSESPLHSVEIALPVPHLPMPHAGDYALQIHCGFAMLGMRRISVMQISEGPQ